MMLGAILAQKHLIIAAVAISGLVVYAFPYNMLASADHRDVNFSRTIEIPCEPYCNVSEPDDVDIDQPPVHIQIRFSFVPFG